MIIFTSFYKASPKRERSTDIDPTQMNYQRSWNEEMMVERLMMEKYSLCRWKGKGLFPIASGGKAQSLVSVELRLTFPRSAYKKITFLLCSPMVFSLLGSKKPVSSLLATLATRLSTWLFATLQGKNHRTTQ